MKRVLLPVDGSQTAQLAAQFLARLPHEGKMELIVLSVLTPPFQPVATLRDDWVDTVKLQDREIAINAYVEISTMFEGANASIEHVVLEGHASESICEVAEKRGCDLIVMGAKGHSAVSRVLLGSTSDHVATHASCSVLVVRPKETADSIHPLRIALAYEETGPAQAALEELAEIQWGNLVEMDVVTVSFLFEHLSTREVKKLRDSCRQGAAQLRGFGFTSEPHLIESEHVGDGLVKYAGRRDSDIFVVGETPRSRLGRLLMGSTSQYVLRHAPCSVWVTRNRQVMGLQKVKEV